MRRFAPALVVLFVTLVVSPTAFAQQRPLSTEDPEPIGAGRLLIEGGLDLANNAEYPVSGLEGNLLRLPTVGVSVGISSIAEFQIDGGFYDRLVIDTRNPNAPLASAVTATGDHGERGLSGFRDRRGVSIDVRSRLHDHRGPDLAEHGVVHADVEHRDPSVQEDLPFLATSIRLMVAVDDLDQARDAAHPIPVRTADDRLTRCAEDGDVVHDRLTRDAEHRRELRSGHGPLGTVQGVEQLRSAFI